MLANQSRHFKHGDLGFAKHGFELGIGIDHAFVFCILEFVGFDIDPQLFDHFGAGQGFCAHHSGQCSAGSQGFHEG